MTDRLGAEIARVQAGAHLSEAFPLIESAIADLEKSVDNRVFSAVNSGTLTAEGAMAFWLERKSYRELVGKLRKIILAGQAVGERLRPQMEALEREMES